MKLKELFRRPYVFWVIGVFIFYITIVSIVTGFYKTIPLLIFYFNTLNWAEFGPSLALSLAIGIFVSMNSVLLYRNYKKRASCRNTGALTGIGVAGGMAVGICPLCTLGMLPLILGVFGVTFSFASLPFKGLEIQFISLLILVFGFYFLKDGVKGGVIR
jgi:hypothetical protein